MKVSDTVTGALALIVGAVVFLVAQTFPPMPGQPVGPSRFPSILGLGLVGLGLVLIFSARGRPREPLIEAAEWLGRPRMVANFATVVGAVLFYALVVNTLGFILTATVFLAVLMLGFGVRRTAIVPLALAVVLAVHFGFYTLLHVPLPWGLLERIAW